MKRLGLLRHAKSSWGEPSLADFDRPLNERGFRDAPRMGALLKERGVSPQRIISSTANRAQTTARLAAEAMGFDASTIRLTGDLYHASATEMLGALVDQGGHVDDAILVGHNPGITSLANRIAIDTRIDNIPTAGFFYIEADISDWADLAKAPGKLLFFASPKHDLS